MVEDGGKIQGENWMRQGRAQSPDPARGNLRLEIFGGC